MVRAGNAPKGKMKKIKGVGRPKTPKWKHRWRAWEQAQDALKPKEQKTFHTSVPRQGLPSATKTVEFPGGKTLDVKITKE